MRALVVKGHEGGAASLELGEVPRPEPQPGQVLIEVSASPINPNDLLALRGAYEIEKSVGEVAGFEGSGKVIAGSGFLARLMIGRRVAFAAAAKSGAWAELAVADVMRCVPLDRRISDEVGATMLTNPFTAEVLLDRARREGHRAVVQGAAAGSLGKMLLRLAQARGIPMIHVVRSPANVELLRGMGADHVLDSNDPAFDSKLRKLCGDLHATLALDPVGGELTPSLLRALDDGGVVRVYGNLSSEPPRIDPGELLYRRKRVEGFTMYQWIESTSLLGQLSTARRVQKLLDGPLATEVRSRVPFTRFETAMADYQRAMSGGKILFVPHASAS